MTDSSPTSSHHRIVIAGGGSLAVLTTWLIRRPMTLVAFDSDYAASLGYDVRRIDLLMMALVLSVTVIGLKLVGLILIVAILIIPAVAARLSRSSAPREGWGALPQRHRRPKPTSRGSTLRSRRSNY